MSLSSAEPRREVLRTACPLDCPDSCSLEAHVEHDRLLRLEGDHRNSVTQGFICTKVRKFPELVYGADRLLYPAVRIGRKGAGEFRRATWDEALALVAERLAEIRQHDGGEAILPYSYGGSNGALTQGTTDERLFRRLGASRLERTVCAAATTRAAQGLYGRMPGATYQDFPLAKLIVVWGANPSASGIHLVPFIEEARKRGARLAVVDPRAIPLAKQADLHLAPRPGTDLPLALSLVRWLFEHGRADLDFLGEHASGVEQLRAKAAPWTLTEAEHATGVPAADIERLAALYAESSPALIRCGWGLERNRNGGSAVAAVLALPAVAGKFGVAGGGYLLSSSSNWNLSTEAAVGESVPAVRSFNMNQLGRQLTDETLAPPIRALFVYNSNALATTPDQRRVRAGLEREDLFTVVFDAVATDTSHYADVLLPATTFLEHDELSKGYGATVLQRGRPVIAPVGEARPNFDVFLELCDRLELSRPADLRTTAEFERAALAANGDGERLAAALDVDGSAQLAVERPVQMVDIFPRTADRRVHLFPAALDAEAPHGLYTFQPDPASERFPLALISPASNRTISSTLGQRQKKLATLMLNPADAERRGIADGDAVRLWNEWGEVRCPVRLSVEIKPGVAALPKGLWGRSTLDGNTANALAPDTLTDLGRGACFNDARVEVERLDAAPPRAAGA